MKVETIQIKHFRSISYCELTSCADFNVLIGKNNSGKSNILAAINAFFLAVNEEGIVCLDPAINKDVDFHNKDSSTPVEVALTFLLDEHEFDELVAGLIDDSPQMTNAVNALNRDSRLSVGVRFNMRPNIYAYVNRISLVSRTENWEWRSNYEEVLLDIDLGAALELHEKHMQYQSDETRIDALKEFLSDTDPDDWMRMRRDLADDSRSYRSRLALSRRHPAEPATLQSLAPMMRDSSTFEEFRSALEKEIETLTRLASHSDKHRLDHHSVDTFAGRESVIPRHVLAILRNLSAVKVLNVTDNRRPIGRIEAQRLLNLKMQRGGQEPLKRIQEIVSSLLGVQIDAFSGGTATRARGLLAELDVDDFVVEVNGSGIKEALRLLLDIEFQEPNFLLVEEPEIHLHPGMETTMLRHLREVSRDRQMFITTHSTNFLDTAAMKNIYLVSKDDTTSARLLDQSDVEEQIPTQLGIRLSSLFIYDRLVFVESHTDEDILRAWALTCGVNFDQASVGFIHMDGARNLSYFAADATLSFFSKRQVKMWFMIDRDEREEDDIKVIRERLGDHAVASVLEKREIENYLIHPRILVEHVEAKLCENGIQCESPPDTESVKALIEESAEKLKNHAISKRIAKTLLQPLYPDPTKELRFIEEKGPDERVSAQITSWEKKVAKLKCAIIPETKRQTQEVASRWDNEKLDIVPGDWLIDMVYRQFGLRFRKERGDGVELARMMTSDEIGSELCTLIRSIGT